MADDTFLLGGGSVITGTITLSGSIQSLPSASPNPLINVWVQADSGNANVVEILGTYTDDVGLRMVAGMYWSIDLGDSSLLRFRGTAGQTLRWGAVTK